MLLATLLSFAELGVGWWLGLAAGGGLRQCAAEGTYREQLGAGTLHKRLEQGGEDQRMPVAGSQSRAQWGAAAC